MRYLQSYKIFEEEAKDKQQEVDLSDELSDIGKDLQSKGQQMQDLVLKIAQSDPELKDKIEDRKKGQDQGQENQEGDQENKEQKQNESVFNFEKDLKELEEVNEGIALGLALSSGAIIELAGKFLGFIGKKLGAKDEDRVVKVAQSIEKYGHKIHHKLINLINTILKPLIFWLPKKRQQQVSNVVFVAILAWKISSGSVDPSDYQTAGQMAEGVLNTIKATEIGAFIKDSAKGLVQLVKLV